MGVLLKQDRVEDKLNAIWVDFFPGPRQSQPHVEFRYGVGIPRAELEERGKNVLHAPYSSKSDHVYVAFRLGGKVIDFSNVRKELDDREVATSLQEQVRDYVRQEAIAASFRMRE